jgi:hypothetical protein
MDLLQQPMLTLRNDPLMGVSPIVQILRNGQRVANANPFVSVALELNVPNADFTADSVTTVQAVDGLANFTAIWLTKAATIRESFLPAWQESYGFVDSVTFTLRFSCPGYADVISRNFEVNPIVRLTTQPFSDTITVKRFVCSGPASGCAVNISDYLKPGDKLQTASLDIDIACTDLDQPSEYIATISVGGAPLPAGAYDPGPWPSCAYAGCRDGECPTSTSPGKVRRAVSQLNLLPRIGSDDPRTGLYSSKGPPLPVALQLTEQVNMCPCGGAALLAVVTLRMTVSARAEAQLLPLFQQPVVELIDGDGSRYTFATKLVSAAILVNPASALLAGTPVVQAAAGVAAFTDLVVTEGGPGYVVRFSIAGGTRYADSEAFGVGYGNYPLVSLDCLDLPCAQPLAKVNVEGSVLFLPPTVALQRAGGARTASTLRVSLRLGLAGPGGRLKGPTTKLVGGQAVDYCQIVEDGSSVACGLPAAQGAVTFDGLSLFNGNCANSVQQCLQAGYPATCGPGYTFIFLANGVSAESLAFDVAGNNRSPQWVDPTPPSGALVPAVVGAPVRLTLNASDANFNAVGFCESTGSVRPGVTPQVPCTAYMSAARRGAGPQWEGAVAFRDLPEAIDDLADEWMGSSGGLRACDAASLLLQQASAPNGFRCLCNPSNNTGRVAAAVEATITPLCAHAPAVYPSGPALRPLCFYAYDVGLKDAAQAPVYTYSPQRCVTVAIGTPSAPAFLRPYPRAQPDADPGIPPAGRFTAQAPPHPPGTLARPPPRARTPDHARMARRARTPPHPRSHPPARPPHAIPAHLACTHPRTPCVHPSSALPPRSRTRSAPRTVRLPCPAAVPCRRAAAPCPATLPCHRAAVPCHRAPAPRRPPFARGRLVGVGGRWGAGWRWRWRQRT